MKPAPFAYHAPRSLPALLGLLATLDDARMLAGGQSLVPMMNLRLAGPANLIDLNKVAGLDGVAVEGGVLRLGAMVRQRAAERAALIAEHAPLLAEALDWVGHQQTRNRGTIGGSLAHMDPTAELPVVASAMEAVLHLESQRGARDVAFADWSAGYLATQIAPDEVLTRIDIPLWPKGHGWGFAEVTRSGEGLAMVAAAALLRLDSAGRISRAAIAVGALAACPLRAAQAEALLIGQEPSDALIAAAARAAAALPAEGDVYAPADYKQHLAGVLTARCLRTARERCAHV